MTVGGDASVAGRLELFGGQALAENQSSEDVLASAVASVMLDVGGKLAVTGDTTLHGTDANVIRVGEARAVGDGRASDAGVMRIRVTGDSVIGGRPGVAGGLGGHHEHEAPRIPRRPRASPCVCGARRPARRPGHHAASGSARWDVRGGTSGSTVSPRGRQQPSGERQPDQRWSGQRAGGHPLRGCPTRHAGIPRDRHRRARLRRRRIRLAVGGGDALSAIRTDWSWPASPAPGCRQPGPAVPMARPSLPLARCAARQRPSVTPAASASARWTCATPAPN